MAATFSLASVLAGLALAIFVVWLVTHRLRQRRMRDRPDAPISPPQGDTAPVKLRRPR